MIRMIRDVVDGLGGPTKVAKSLSLPVSTVGAWKSRNAVPDEYRPALVELAKSVGLDWVTYESLTLMHAGSARGSSEAALP